MASKPQVGRQWTTASREYPLRGLGREATRYLCGAAYTDGTFREAVLGRNRETVRARSPEVGVDVDLVTDHCRRADRSKTVRDLLLCAPSVVFLLALFASIEGPIPPLVIQAAILSWLVAVVIVAVRDFRTDGVMRRELTRGRFQARAEDTATARDGNVVIYSGFSPFVGAGSDLGGWSFAIDLERGKNGVVSQSPQPFALAELYDHVAEVFDRLHIANLRLSRKLFVSGRCVRGETQFLPDMHARPIDRLPDDIVAEYADNDSRQVRHYLCVESVDWDGEIAVTRFIRCQKLSSKLFVELSAFLLPPLKATYYDLDKIHPERRFRDAVALLTAAMLKAPFLLAWAPIATLGRIQTKLGRRGERRRQYDLIENDLLFDYGANKSLRELAAGKEWRVYFQKLDKEMHHKILQQQLLDSLVDFLDAHGVDTSEIRERTTHILNNGVIVSGGSINAQGLAVGEGAQAKVANAARRTRETVSA